MFHHRDVNNTAACQQLLLLLSSHTLWVSVDDDDEEDDDDERRETDRPTPARSRVSSVSLYVSVTLFCNSGVKNNIIDQWFSNFQSPFLLNPKTPLTHLNSMLEWSPSGLYASVFSACRDFCFAENETMRQVDLSSCNF